MAPANLTGLRIVLFHHSVAIGDTLITGTHLESWPVRAQVHVSNPSTLLVPSKKNVL